MKKIRIAVGSEIMYLHHRVFFLTNCLRHNHPRSTPSSNAKSNCSIQFGDLFLTKLSPNDSSGFAFTTPVDFTALSTRRQPDNPTRQKFHNGGTQNAPTSGSFQANDKIEMDLERPGATRLACNRMRNQLAAELKILKA